MSGPARCSSCNAPVVWLPTNRPGKRMPVDAETVEPGDRQFDYAKHRSHFATCPHADAHRRRT